MATSLEKALTKMMDVVPSIDDGELDEMQMKRKKISEQKAKEGVKSGMIWSDNGLTIDGKSKL